MGTSLRVERSQQSFMAHHAPVGKAEYGLEGGTQLDIAMTISFPYNGRVIHGWKSMLHAVVWVEAMRTLACRDRESALWIQSGQKATLGEGTRYHSLNPLDTDETAESCTTDARLSSRRTPRRCRASSRACSNLKTQGS
jgi:hypothetical protein